MFPAFTVSDVTSLGGGDHRSSGFNNYNGAVSLSRAVRTHFLKAGYEGRMLRINVWEARAAGSYTFSRLFTQGPNPLATTALGGHGFASFLLGTGSSGLLYQNWKNVAAQSFYHAWYLQDDWRVTDRLTVNAGLRYDFDVPRTERYDRMSWFDPDARSPLADVVPGFSDLRGGLRFVGVDGNSRSQYQGDWNNLAPRVGAAYQLTPKTVLRGAVGRFFGPSTLAAQGTVGPYGFRVETPWIATLDNLTPVNLLRNPFPQGFRPVPGAADGLLTAIGGRVEAPLTDTTTPYVWQWNVTVQRELPGGVLVEAAYVGNRGRELSLGGEGGYTLNQLDPSYLSLGTALNQLVPNPFYGSVATGPLSQQTVARGQLLRPYPQFGDIIPLFYQGAQSSYDAFQLTVSRRLANGFGFEGSYVASKSMDWGQSYQNAYDLSSANALSGVHVPYRVVLSGIYQLPIGRGRAVGSQMSPVLDAIRRGLASQRHLDAAGRSDTRHRRVEQLGRLQPGHPRELDRGGSGARRRRGRQARSLVQSNCLQPAGAVHVRQRARAHPRPPRAPPQQRGPVADQGTAARVLVPSRAAGRGVQHLQLRAVRIAEHDSEQRDRRAGHVAGERATADAVWREGDLVARRSLSPAEENRSTRAREVFAQPPRSPHSRRAKREAGRRDRECKRQSGHSRRLYSRSRLPGQRRPLLVAGRRASAELHQREARGSCHR